MENKPNKKVVGPECIVEIDESFFTERKNNCGRVLQWVDSETSDSVALILSANITGLHLDEDCNYSLSSTSNSSGIDAPIKEEIIKEQSTIQGVGIKREVLDEIISLGYDKHTHAKEVDNEVIMDDDSSGIDMSIKEEIIEEQLVIPEVWIKQEVFDEELYPQVECDELSDAEEVNDMSMDDDTSVGLALKEEKGTFTSKSNTSMEKQKKRKHMTLSLTEKLAVLERIDKGEPVRKIAREIGVGETTIKDWRRKRKDIELFSMAADKEQSRKTLKKPKLNSLDDALWIWFNEECKKGTQLSGPMIKEKAIALHSKMRGSDSTTEVFTASEGWLHRWKMRHGIRQLSISVKKFSVDNEGSKAFIEKFEKIITDSNLRPEQVYNFVETGLNYKILPNKTLKNGQISIINSSMERITIALCSNASGDHKLPLFVIGKSKKPRAFKNLNMNSLPVYYKNQKYAWMDSTLFTDWFENEFTPSVEKFLKSKNLTSQAILLLNNVPSHPSETALKSREIKSLFLPSNVAPLIQPMDQGIIEYFKRKYRQKFIGSILEQENRDLIQAIRMLSIKDVIYSVALAWDEISPEILQRSWLKLLPSMSGVENRMDENDEDELLIDIFEGLKSMNSSIEICDVAEWLNDADENDNHNDDVFLSDDEIVTASQSEEEEVDDGNEEGTPEASRRISHSEAKDAFEIALRYVEAHESSMPVDILMLKRWRDMAAKSWESGLQQKKITDFFLEGKTKHLPGEHLTVVCTNTLNV